MTERFPIPSPQDMTAAQQRVVQALLDSPRKGVRGPFPLLLSKPDIADAARMMGDSVRYENTLPARLVELAICMVVLHWKNEREWETHSAIAEKAGLDGTILPEIRSGRTPSDLGREEAAVYDVVTALLSGRRLGDEDFERACEVLSRTGLVDVICAVGYYNFVCTVMNAIG